MKSVRFGTRSALKIVDNDMLRVIREGIEDKIGYSINTKRYSLLNEKNLNRLENSPHRVGVNTLGQRFLLFLTTVQVEGKPKRYSIFINRKSGMMIIVRFRFSTDLFTSSQGESFHGTLMEGELVRIKRDREVRWYYLISDLLVDRGEFAKTLDERLTRLSEIITDHHVSDGKQDPCSLKIKKYFGYEYIRSIVQDFMPSLSYQEAVTGLSFKSDSTQMLYILPEFRNNAPVKTTVKKVKIPNKSIRKTPKKGHFRVVAETALPDVYELYDGDGQSVGYAIIPDTKTSKLMKQLIDGTDGKNLYVHCTFDKKFSKWAPYKRAAPF